LIWIHRRVYQTRNAHVVAMTAKPVVFTLGAMIYRPVVQIYQTRRTFSAIIAALFEM
jgi:hypothetical protein